MIITNVNETIKFNDVHYFPVFLHDFAIQIQYINVIWLYKTEII